MSFEPLYQPFEHIDEWLSGHLDGAPILAALVLAAVLGLRHASDPDHLVAVTSLVATRDGRARSSMWIGAWWGIGHGSVLVLVGAPLILARSSVPDWLGSAAETAIGFVTIALALRILWKWARGGYRVGPHRHGDEVHRHVHQGASHGHVRTLREALGLGALHGLGGSGAVVVLLIAGMPNTTVALAALLLYAVMTAISMACCTGAYSWVLTRELLQPLYRGVLIPAFALFSLAFGVWYAGLA